VKGFSIIAKILFYYLFLLHLNIEIQNMETKHKITIPKPCHENWDEMTPKENGRFCLSCSKTVIDFTSMLPEEVQYFFIQNQNESVCGRFKNDQLESIIIQIPTRILFTQTHYHKMFLLALFIAMGTTLFSCQDKDGKKQKIDKVEIVEEPQQITVGVALTPKHDPNTKLPSTSSAKINQVKFVKAGSSIQNVKSSKDKTVNCKQTIPKAEKDSVAYEEIYTTGIVYVVDNIKDPADYPGGQNKFYTFFKRNFVIPEKESKLEGELELAFNINELGKPDNIVVVKDLGKGLAEEGIRVLKLLPKWKPAILNDKALSSPFKVKIIFSQESNLNEIKTKKSKSQIVSINLNPELE
jgi:hypothetical protein